MTLVEEIQREAIDSRSDLGSLLRKCKLLASRLDSLPLEEWLLHESNGYPDSVELPEYRLFPLQLKGNFSGPFGSGLRNAPIPIVCIPEPLRESFSHFHCRQSIATVEQLLRDSGSDPLNTSCGDLALILGQNVYERLNCMQVWGEFSVGHLTELINVVRNRILDFSIALCREFPFAGTESERGNSIASERVTQIFNTTVYGGAANLLGSAVNSPVSFAVEQNDFQSLERELAGLGVDTDDIEELTIALREEPTRPTPATFGPNVSLWIADMVKKSALGTWQVGVGAAGNLLATVIGRFYGL